jgi:hypothetical protein
VLLFHKPFLTCRGDAEADVFDSGPGLELGGELFNNGRSAFHGNDFKAVVMVEMDMLGGNDGVLEIVLDIDELIDQLTFVMVVGHDDRSGDRSAFSPLFSDQFFPYQITDGFRAALVVPGFDMSIERLDQGFIEGNPETVDIAHRLINRVLVAQLQMSGAGAAKACSPFHGNPDGHRQPAMQLPFVETMGFT